VKTSLLFVLFYVFNAVFTLNGLDDQEQNLTFVKTDIQVLKHKFHACNFKQAFYPLHKLHTASRGLDNTKTLLYKLSVRYLVVKSACVNAALQNYTCNFENIDISLKSHDETKLISIVHFLQNKKVEKVF